MSLVLVTGISGFLGAHVVNELLIAGYRVRGTARSGKLALVREAYADSPHKDRFEVVEVNDLVHGDFTEALKGGHTPIKHQLLRCSAHFKASNF